MTPLLRRITGLLALVLTLAGSAYGQSATLSIREAYDLARRNYPLTRQLELIARTANYTVENAAKGRLPVFSVNGQATYQSAVTSFPFTIPVPGFKLPQYSRDQYRFYAEADQVVYDGGVIRNQQEAAEASKVVQQQGIEVQLYGLYERINQLFFGALLAGEEIKENELLMADLQNGVDRARALLANGVAYRSSVEELQAQLLEAQQAGLQFRSVQTAFREMLGDFIQRPLGDSVVLVKPEAPAETSEITRPELLQFRYQRRVYDLQEQLLHTSLRPHISFFLQGGYGRPGLNVLSNAFSWYYLGGLRFNWNIGSLYTLKNQQHLLDINRQSLDVQQETFLFDTRLALRQQGAEVTQYRQLIDRDDSIIALRESVKKAAYAQLENGVLSAHDYINEVNAEDQARQNRITHEVQLLQSQYSYENTSGMTKQ